MLLAALICAVAVLRRAKSPWMLLGSLFMLVASVVPTKIIGFVLTNSGEVVMAASFVATEFLLQKRVQQVVT